jgi:hypothetical protein
MCCSIQCRDLCIGLTKKDNYLAFAIWGVLGSCRLNNPAIQMLLESLRRGLRGKVEVQLVVRPC